MISALVIASGAICTCYGIYQYGASRAAAVTPSNVNLSSVPSKSESAILSLQDLWMRLGPKRYTQSGHAPQQNLAQDNSADLWASAALVGTAAVGGAGIIPLKYVAIPVLAYRGLPAMHATVDTFLNDRKAASGILETAALTIVLVKGAWIVGTVGFAVYHLGRWVITATDDIDTSSNIPYLVKRQNQNMKIPVTQIKAGDWISVSASHAVPVKSKVVDGTAWIYGCGDARDASPSTVKPGDILEKDSVVLAGEMWLEVPR